MKLQFFIMLIVVSVLTVIILTCNIKHSEDWLVRQQAQPDQIQAAMELLQKNPTAVGERK